MLDHNTDTDTQNDLSGMDTGQVARYIVSLILAEKERREKKLTEIESKVQHIADTYDEMHNKGSAWRKAFFRSLKQFLSFIEKEL